MIGKSLDSSPMIAFRSVMQKLLKVSLVHLKRTREASTAFQSQTYQNVMIMVIPMIPFAKVAHLILVSKWAEAAIPIG